MTYFRLSMEKFSSKFCVILLAASPVLVIAAEATIPNAGLILNEVQSEFPSLTTPKSNGLLIEKFPKPTVFPVEKFFVKTIKIIGNKRVGTQILQALVKQAEGKTHTLAELDELISRITNYYAEHGYPLARAIIPAQTIQSGILVVQIIEARYGKITLDNRSRVNAPLLESILSPLKTGDDVTQAELDHALLLLADVAGIGVNATLKPGEEIGTSDLLVIAQQAPMIFGRLTLDGYGNSFTGRERLGGALSIIDPLNLKLSDTLSFSGLSSGSALNYGRIAYETILTGTGTRLGGSYSSLHYSLGGTVTSLMANGNATVTSLWQKQPLIRSQNLNLYEQLQYDYLKLSDSNATFKSERHLNNLTLSMNGDMRDDLFSPSATNFSVALTMGQLGFDDEAAMGEDAISTRTQGAFKKLNVNLSRIQKIGALSGLYFTFAGQWADSNLDPSQKISAGGPYSVRAYETGAISGDTGYLFTAEYQYDLGAGLNGQWKVIGFMDVANITVNKTPWPPIGNNNAIISGIGVGINWSGLDQWNARLHLATPVGAVPELVENTNSTRAWIEVTRGF